MKTRLLACTAIAFCGAQFVQAQETDAADSDAADERRMSTVTVNAQRRDQDILDVPKAVSTLTPELLEAQSVDNVLDITIANPSVTGVSSTLSSPLANMAVRIRGIGTSGTNPGFESAVGYYVDEVYRSRPGAALVGFFDMAGVDILRGPQGTLFGKNTSSGAILQRTVAPEKGENGGYASASIGDYGTYSLEGAANFATSETSALRISGLYHETDGFFTYRNPTDTSDPLNGADTAANDTTAFRIQWAGELSDKLDVRLVGDYSEFNTGQSYGQSVIQGPNTFDREVQVRQISDAAIEQFGIAAYFDYALNENWDLRSITSYREIDGDNVDGDWDFSGLGTAGFLNVFNDFATFSQEFLASGNTNLGGLETDLVFGVHYFNETLDLTRQAATSDELGPGTPGFVFATPLFAFQNLDFDQEETSLGIFGHATIALTDQIDLVGGVRWNDVEKTVDYVNNVGSGSDYFNAVSGTGFFNLAAGAALAGAFPFSAETSNEEVNYDIALQWNPTDNWQLYASFAHGFKSGGFNLTEASAGGQPAPILFPGFAIPGDDPQFNVPGVTTTAAESYRPFDPQAAIFEPEFVDTFEIGVRYRLDNGLIGATYFNSEYEDLQVSVFNGLTFDTLNATDNVTSQGFEFEGVFNLTADLSVNAAATFLDAAYGDTPQLGLPAGRDVAQAPDTSFTIGANYNHDIGGGREVFFNGSYAFTGEHFQAEDGCVDGTGALSVFGPTTCPAATNRIANEVQDSYGLLNLTLGVRSQGNWSASVFCANCTDEEFTSWRFNQPFGPNIMANPAAPSTFGVRVRKDF